MTNILQTVTRMNDFEYDCMIKKRLARQAQHRKRGSKSRLCSLSTDHMTEKQWKERNGKVVSVNLSKPMLWNEFLQLSKPTQREYITRLTNEYNAAAKNLADMFGVDVRVFKSQIAGTGLESRFRAGRRMNKAQHSQWLRFLGEEPEAPTLPAAPEPAPESPAPPDKHMTMVDFSVTFDGKIDTDMIANSLRRIIGPDARGTVQITCRLPSQALETAAVL